jgi:UDP-GlcNAc3NAcA epimerase
MRTKTVVTIVGTRPQFIKAAAVSREFLAVSELTEIIVHTGQHFDENMSSIFFDELNIPPPRYNLHIGGGTHAQNTGRALESIAEVLETEQPDVVLVYGDTDSTLAGALAAAKLNVPLAHVEAGLRSFNRRMPEEINRILTDHLSTLLLTPSRHAVDNLRREGIEGPSVIVTGDVMLDAMKIFGEIAEKHSTIVESLGLTPHEYILLTIHRKENVDDFGRLSTLLAGIATSDKPVIFPVHPRTRRRIHEAGMQLLKPIVAIDPIGYLDMLQLERYAALIATDSGGVQKEAYFHRVPCVTLRDETEWVELVEAGANRIVGVDARTIAENLNWSIENVQHGLYGEGHAAAMISRALAA